MIWCVDNPTNKDFGGEQRAEPFGYIKFNRGLEGQSSQGSVRHVVSLFVSSSQHEHNTIFCPKSTNVGFPNKCVDDFQGLRISLKPSIRQFENNKDKINLVRTVAVSIVLLLLPLLLQLSIGEGTMNTRTVGMTSVTDAPSWSSSTHSCMFNRRPGTRDHRPPCSSQAPTNARAAAEEEETCCWWSWWR